MPAMIYVMAGRAEFTEFPCDKEQGEMSKARYNNLYFASPTLLALAPCYLLSESPKPVSQKLSFPSRGLCALPCPPL